MGLLDLFTRRTDGRAGPLTPPPIAPMEQPPTGKPGKITLAVIVGAGVAAALGQFIPQEESGRKVEATVAKDGSLQVRHISGKQYLRAYLDMVGASTACDGITTYEGKPIPTGAVFTEAQCAAMLEEELIKHAQGVMRCTPGLALSSNPAIERRREGPRFAAVSGAYNFGIGNYCGSTAAKRFNAGAYDSGCEALKRFERGTFATPRPGGECIRKPTGGWSCVIKGLRLRREREHRVCIGGLGVLK